MKGDEERFLETGMNAYLAKPLDLAHFEQVVRNVAASAPRSDASPGKTSGEASGPATLGTSVEQDPPFDIPLQEQRFASMQDFLPELLDLFSKNVGPSLKALRGSLDKNDLPEASKAAHTLKGMASVVCATPVQTLAGEVEDVARKGDAQGARALLVALDEAVSRALAYLNGLPKA